MPVPYYCRTFRVQNLFKTLKESLLRMICFSNAWCLIVIYLSLRYVFFLLLPIKLYLTGIISLQTRLEKGNPDSKKIISALLHKCLNLYANSKDRRGKLFTPFKGDPCMTSVDSIFVLSLSRTRTQVIGHLQPLREDSRRS